MSAAFRVRAARPEDAEDMAACWVRAFGDAPEFVRDMFSAAGLPELAMVAEAEGRVRAVSFAFDGLTFGGRPAAYRYALCTQPEYRGLGMGEAVCMATTRLCFERGAELVCGAPASAGLEQWYRRAMGMKVLQRYGETPVTPGPGSGAACVPVGAAEYARLRDGKSDIAVTPRLLAAQETLFRHYGGGFFRVGDGAACALPVGDGVLVTELFCAPGERDAALSGLSAAFGGKPLRLRKRARQGKALLYLTRDGAALREKPRGLFPFTLD